MNRGRLAAALSAAVLLTGLTLVQPSSAELTGVEPQATWQLRWAPEASRDGPDAFEGIEDDRANSHPAGQPHIFVQGNDFRFNMHMVDRDTSTDRQRQEVKGMRSPQDCYLLISNMRAYQLCQARAGRHRPAERSRSRSTREPTRSGSPIRTHGRRTSTGSPSARGEPHATTR